MLESMRTHAQSWLAKLILGGVALSFVLWGVGDYFLGSRVQSVAEVDGQPIADAAFYQAYERQLNRYRAALGARFSKKQMEALGLKQNTLETLINRQIMLSEAEKMGLAAPKNMLLARIQSNPLFLSSGHFDAQRYQILTRNMGFRNPVDYEQSVRLDMMVDALQSAVLNTSHVSDAAIRAQFNTQYEKRVLAALIVEPSALKHNIQTTDTQARAYFDAHKQQYRSPLRLKFDVVTIDPALIAKDIAINEDDIKVAYEEQKDHFFIPEQRRARHILVRVAKDASADMRKLARGRIEQAQARIKKGESFAAVAKDVSNDVTASKGGDLGYFGKGSMIPAFEKAVFDLKKGGISDIVETPFGYHLIQLEDIHSAGQKSLQDVHDQLSRELMQTRAGDEAYKLSQDLDDALGREDTLKAAAESINLKIRIVGPISRDEALADPLLSKNPAFRAKVFAMNANDPVEVSDLDHGGFAAIAMIARVEPDTLPFAQAAKQVYADATQQMLDKKAKEQAEKIRSDASNTTLSKLAQKYAIPLYISKPVQSSGAGDDATWLIPSLLKAAFDVTQKAVISHVVKTPKGYAIVQVRNIFTAKEAEFSKQAPGIRAKLKRSNGAVRFARWMASVRDRHELVRHPEVLNRF